MLGKTLSYSDETDRAYGVAGMAIALMLWDGDDYLDSLSIDSPVGAALHLTPAFGFNGNPRLMASLAWRQHLRQLELTSAMIMGNAICRAYIHRSNPLTADASRSLRDIIRNEGRETCTLDEDEADMLYNKTQRYLDRVFTHSAVATLAHNLADSLCRQRQLSASQVFDILRDLNRL